VSSPRIVLYGPRGLSLVEKVGRGLRLKRLAFALVEPDGPEDFERLSPETGLLPVLEVDGERIPDSKAILDFLDQRFPDPPLLASDVRVAREQRGLERWMDETFAYHMLRWLRGRTDDGQVAPAPGGGFPLGALSQRGVLGPRGQLHPEVAADGDGPGPEFERSLDHLQNLLGSRPFFFSDRPSRADLSVFGALALMHREFYPGARALLARRKRLLAHVERLADATGGMGPV
jgi:glutathione S-transferase